MGVEAELLLVLGILAFAVYELIKTRRELRKSRADKPPSKDE
ncbi:hypothetical protein [Rhodomicrobium sp. Az07]|nr:hypothetical protein [Rhodomicrobium sp. Az07]